MDAELQRDSQGEPNPAPLDLFPVHVRVCKAVVSIARTLYCYKGMLVIALLLNVGHVLFVYFLVLSETYPLPPNTINESPEKLTAFLTITIVWSILTIFGDIVLVVMCGFLFPPQDVSHRLLFIGLVGFPAIVAVMFYPLVLRRYMLESSVTHACDGDWMTVRRIDGIHHYFAATFALNSSPSEVQFAFTFTQLDATVLHLSYVAPTASVLPALQDITYNFYDRMVSGICYNSNSNSSSSSTCLSGTYDTSDYLTFDLSSANGTRTVIRSVYKPWWIQDSPAVIMSRVNLTSDDRVQRALQTSVGVQKVCIDPIIAGDVLGPEILVAIGWLLRVKLWGL